MRKLILLLLSACAALSHAADLSITAANVVPSNNAVVRYATAGATIAAGQLVYLDAADLDVNNFGKAKLSDANAATAIRVVEGIAVNSASAGQRVSYVTYDPALVIAASGLTVNAVLISSATAGGIAPVADLTTGWYLHAVAVVKSATTVYFRAPGLISSAAN
jgi:hypothetical protein